MRLFKLEYAERLAGYLSCSVLNNNAAIVPTVADLQRVLGRELARTNDRPNTSLVYVCPRTGKRRLRTPNEIPCTSRLSAGRSETKPYSAADVLNPCTLAHFFILVIEC